MSSPCIVLCSCPDEPNAKKIAYQLVEERLAACVHITSSIQSIYRWEGKTCEDREVQLWIKSTSELFLRISAKIQELHPFKVPQIISIPIQDGFLDYLNWLKKEVE